MGEWGREDEQEGEDKRCPEAMAGGAGQQPEERDGHAIVHLILCLANLPAHLDW